MITSRAVSVAIVALALSGYADHGNTADARLTEYQYHWLRGCDAVLWEYPGDTNSEKIGRAAALHRLGCEKATQAQYNAAVREAAKGASGAAPR